MSEVQNTQTAVDESNVPAQPGTTDTGAQNDGNDLDKLLSEFDSSTKPAPQVPTQPEPKAGTDDLKALTDQVKGLLSEQQNVKFRQDMDSTIKNVRGDLNPELFDDRFIEAHINAQAADDPRLAQAWLNRHSNPKQFQKVVETIGRQFQKKWSQLPDKVATEDREAVSAAVRGASTRVPEGKATNYSRLTPAEFQAEKDRLFGG